LAKLAVELYLAMVLDLKAPQCLLDGIPAKKYFCIQSSCRWTDSRLRRARSFATGLGTSSILFLSPGCAFVRASLEMAPDRAAAALPILYLLITHVSTASEAHGLSRSGS